MPTTAPRRAGSRSAASALTIALLLVLAACAGGPGGPRPTGSGTPSPAPPSYQRYVALGDSYSSAPLVPVTDLADGCFRSSVNYPSLVAKALGSQLHDVTCGGAESGNVNHAQSQVPPQRTALKPDTELVTVGLGGNDERLFTRLVYACTLVRSPNPQGSPCRAKQQRGSGDALLEVLQRTSARITVVLKEIKLLSPRAKVLLVGYPHIVDPRHRCAKLPLARGDYAYVQSIIKALNRALRRAATLTGTTYVDTFAASTGHDICATQPWINGDVTLRTKALAYHPFAVEQREVARLVLHALGR